VVVGRPVLEAADASAVIAAYESSLAAALQAKGGK
jgi:hypothetical protein